MARNVVGCCLVLVAVLGSAACSGSGDGVATGGTAKAVGTTAPWARDVQTGDLMWTVTQDGLTVTAYDMGRDTTTQDSYFSDDATNEPLVKAGSPVAMVNIVLTNSGTTTAYVATDTPSVRALTTDHPYPQGLEKITPVSDRQMSSHGVWYHSTRSPHPGYNPPYPLEPGQSCAMGFALPLTLGDDWLFFPSAYVYDTPETGIGDMVMFEEQAYTLT
ncbi:MAG: hypothetical protein FWF02_05590 [Micrococcales bacterium]|nr:hypothetical protein [Micrococcales bacterium]MCL2667166.1 hypothetical protein [Micrococcales bacterium]